jgi:peptidoglycan hydrolase CwlO-like protein
MLRKSGIVIVVICLATVFIFKANAHQITPGGNPQGQGQGDRLRQEIQSLKQQEEQLQSQIQQIEAQAKPLREQLSSIRAKIRADREKIRNLRQEDRQQR